jgi:hypothetical protein
MVSWFGKVLIETLALLIWGFDTVTAKVQFVR